MPADAVRPEFKGNFPYMDYNGNMPFAPETSDACVNCGACVRACPMDNINPETKQCDGGHCIQCCACVKTCPKGAKAMTPEPFLGIVAWLEGSCIERREGELFL